MSASFNRERNLITIHNASKLAANLGIRIVPITGSGIDEITESLSRFLSIVTYGTYIYLTDSSKIGESHHKSSVGSGKIGYFRDIIYTVIKENL